VTGRQADREAQRRRTKAPGKAARAADGGRAKARPRPGRAAAPAREPRTSRSAPQTSPIARPVERVARPKNASQAKARAKARKAKAPKVVRPPLRDRLLHRLASIDLRPRTLAGKVPFVVLVIGSLGAGLGVTLWLSTDSAERSYQLGSARAKTQLLQQQKEALEREVLQAQAAPELAEAARNLGMIPSKDTAHLVQDAGGNWVVVGTPRPAEGAPPPPLNSRLPDEKPTHLPGAPGAPGPVPAAPPPPGPVPPEPVTAAPAPPAEQLAPLPGTSDGAPR
jgi:hypothetical protein